MIGRRDFFCDLHLLTSQAGLGNMAARLPPNGAMTSLGVPVPVTPLLRPNLALLFVVIAWATNISASALLMEHWDF